MLSDRNQVCLKSVWKARINQIKYKLDLMFRKKKYKYGTYDLQCKQNESRTFNDRIQHQRIKSHW